MTRIDNARLVATVALALLAASSAFGLYVAIRMALGGSDRVSAQEVVNQAKAAQARVLEGIGPDTTMHVVQVGYRADPPAPGPWALPERWRTEYWAYVAPNGALAGFVSQTRDEETGALVQAATWADGALSITDTASGDTETVPLAAASNKTGEVLRARLDELQEQSWDLVATDARAGSTVVRGQDAYVVDLAWAQGIQRTYVAKEDYRTLKWERIVGDTIVESRETPSFEVVAGNALPGEQEQLDVTQTPAAPGSASVEVTGPGGSQPLDTPFVVTDILTAFTSGSSATWSGWELELLYDTDVLAVDSVVPGSLCPASKWANIETSPHVVTGCSFQSSAATGTLEQVTFRCIASGTSAIVLLARGNPVRNANGTALFDGSAVDFAMTLTGSSVTCG